MSVAKAPTLDPSADPVLAAVLEGTADPAGAVVGDLLGGATGAGTSDIGMAIVALDTSLGAWQYSADDGATWITIAAALINSSTNELALLLGDAARIRLLPYGDQHGSLDHAITFRAWDTRSGHQGDYVTVTATGGSTPFSTATDSASIQVTKANDAPTFSWGSGKEVFGLAGFGQSVFAQPDGKILLAGSVDSGSHYAFGVLRLNADGTPDTSFNGTGTALIPLNYSGSTRGYSLAVQPDGRILVAGDTYQDGWCISIARLNADGTLDTSFNGTGTVVGGLPGFGGWGVTVQPDGKILTTGWTLSIADISVFRLNADGTLDTGFNGSGKAIVSFGSSREFGTSTVVQSDGRILVAGYTLHDGLSSYAVARLNADGTLDTSFNGTGTAKFEVGSSRQDEGWSIVVQPDGKILVAGIAVSAGKGAFGIARLNSDGTFDTSFHGTGKASIRVGSWENEVRSVTVQHDGKIVMAGTADDDFAVVRLNADGSLDTTFNGTGTVKVNVGIWDDRGMSVAVQPDGRIIVAGTADDPANYWNFSAIRLNADGSLDTTFNPAPSLGGTISYTEGADAIALDSAVAIHDPELAAMGNYSGASVTLARHGGASADDHFRAIGNLSFSAGNAVLSGVTIGTYAESDGTLSITFNTAATQDYVNQALSSIGYANTSHLPPASVQIDWTFSDGNSGAQGAGGALAATGSTKINITATAEPITASELFDWAESAYPDLFPEHQPDLVYDPYVYRYYPSTHNYVGVWGQSIYIMGTVTGGMEPFYVGEIDMFAAMVRGDA